MTDMAPRSATPCTEYSSPCENDTTEDTNEDQTAETPRFNLSFSGQTLILFAFIIQHNGM